MLAFLAQSKNSREIINEFAKSGLSINERNPKQMTALAYAVAANDYEACVNLIKMGADVNITVNKDNWSPLMIAVTNQNKNIIKALLDVGANHDLKSKSGITAGDIAERIGNSEITKMLQSTKI